VRRGLRRCACSSAPNAVGEQLRGTSLVVVGDAHALNETVVRVLATRLGYTPLLLGAMIEQLAGQGWPALLQAEGAASLALAEAQILEQLSTQGRTCVATVGGGQGAAARSAVWRHLHGAFAIWLDAGADAADALAPQRVRLSVVRLLELMRTPARTHMLSQRCSWRCRRALRSLESLLQTRLSAHLSFCFCVSLPFLRRSSCM
jgi:shikimate kinase